MIRIKISIEVDDQPKRKAELEIPKGRVWLSAFPADALAEACEEVSRTVVSQTLNDLFYIDPK
jgi:hypothetical protein